MGTVKVHSKTYNDNMDALVILAVLGSACAHVTHLGVADTPAVAAAKARFFQTYNAQAAAARAASPQQATFVQQQPRWTGPMAHTVPAGVNVHHAAVNSFHVPAAVRTVTQKWTGPVAATVPAGVQGLNQVPDTADVQAATRSFLAAYNAQLAATRSAAPVVAVHHQAPANVWAPAAPVQTWSPAAPVQPRWTGPMAATVPAGVHGAPAQVAQTADVAAATQGHCAAHQHALRATQG